MQQNDAVFDATADIIGDVDAYPVADGRRQVAFAPFPSRADVQVQTTSSHKVIDDDA